MMIKRENHRNIKVTHGETRGKNIEANEKQIKKQALGGGVRMVCKPVLLCRLGDFRLLAT